jgi:hypothetical protein
MVITMLFYLFLANILTKDHFFHKVQISVYSIGALLGDKSVNAWIAQQEVRVTSQYFTTNGASVAPL